VGSSGAAAAAGNILGLDEEKQTSALGLAGLRLGTDGILRRFHAEAH